MMAIVKNPDSGKQTPQFWDEACKHLVKKDRVMKRLIPQFGDACLETRGDAFVTLARSIVGSTNFGQGGANRVGSIFVVATQDDPWQCTQAQS